MNLDAVIKQPQEGRSLRRRQTSHIQPREVAGRQVLRWPIHRLTREHAASKIQRESLPETPGCQGLPGAAAGKTQSVGLA